jgi:hypothetical protein
MRQWLYQQGDMRGFLINEGSHEYLVIWDSYGATHSDMVKAIGGLRGRVWSSCLIFRTNGRVFNEHNARGEIKDPVIRAIYRPLIPHWTLD